ncbi:unnamed protein product [Discula destructiva]
MSRHRIFQNYDYENELDDFDGQGEAEDEEDGQDELSPEDKVQMAEGTAEIISLLGPQADKVTTRQIQDALWHYYYDIDKSVAYLVGKFVEPTSKPAAKPKPPQVKSSQDSSSREPTISMAAFFADMPWLNIPEDRRTTFIAPPRPRGRLLGGSSTPKLSKLQALAAARKRKADEAATLVILPKQEIDAEEEPSKSEALQPESRRHVAKADIARKKTKNEPARQVEEGKEDRTQEPISQGLTPNNDALGWSSQSRPRPQTDGALDEMRMARPSAFAQVLCSGSAPATSSALSPAPQTVQTASLVPWAAFTTPEALREAFDQPSPDDIVFAAQAKSALTQSQPKCAPSRGESRK